MKSTFFMNKKIALLIVVSIAFMNMEGIAQQQALKPDLSKVSNFNTVNRRLTVSNQQGKTIVHLDAKLGDGVAWINNVNFEKGVLEFDVKGKNIMQQSFVGIAFHGANDSAFEGVYFRPFNFQSADAERKGHSVQYISLPQFDWSVLREKYPGKYENALSKTVDPQSWFHAKVVVDGENITVFVNNDSKASLLVKPLAERTNGKMGFWVGNNSEGDFANLSISR
jgi:hypothetical protein